MKKSQYCFKALTLISFLAFSIFAQEKIRKIENAARFDGQPLELISSTVGNHTANKDGYILANKDWLKDLNMNLKNTSKKNIIYIKIYLQIEAQAKMQHPLRIPLSFGQKPSTKSVNPSSNNDVAEIQILKPNENAKISVKSHQLESANKFVEMNEISDINSVKVYFDFIIFDDGTAWSQGQIMRQNPENHQEYKVVNNSQNMNSPQNLFSPNLLFKLRNNMDSVYLTPFVSTMSGFFLLKILKMQQISSLI